MSLRSNQGNSLLDFDSGAITSDTPVDFELGRIRAGDVIFFNTNSPHFWPRLKRNVNVIGQRLLVVFRTTKNRISIFDRIPRYSHVLLGLDGGIVIHADGKSVEIEVITDALHIATSEQGNYSIYRLKGISDETRQKISSEAIRYYNQKYAFSPFFRKISDVSKQAPVRREDTTQFCSRLVACAYRAAGIELTDIPDRKVLPVDLYRICSTPQWEDITQEFESSPISDDIDGIIDPIKGPNGEELTVSSFMGATSALLKKNAALLAKFEKYKYELLKDQLRTEALLAQFCSAQFDKAKHVRIQPGEIDENVAEVISRVLGQVDALLELSKIPDLKLLATDTFATLDSDGCDKGTYVGFPTTRAMRELELSREEIRVYAYLLFAETGIFTILAHYMPKENYRMFEVTDRRIADKFIASITRSGDLTAYDKPQELFTWIDNEEDRSMSRKVLVSIVAGLKVIDILRSASKTDGDSTPSE